MNKFSRILTVLIALASAAAAVLCWLKIRERKDLEELDAWLEAEDAPAFESAADAFVDEDLDHPGSGETVQYSYRIDPENAGKLAEELARAGISSSYDPETQIFDLVLNPDESGEQTEEQVHQLCAKYNALYLGFASV